MTTRIFNINIGGSGTSGTFELHLSPEAGGCVKTTGQIPVDSTSSQMEELLTTLFGSTVQVTDVPDPGYGASDNETAPKSWQVRAPGMLWVAPMGAPDLTGSAGPRINIIYVGSE